MPPGSLAETVWLGGCTGLTKESIIALKVALPNTIIVSDYSPSGDALR